MYIYIYIVSVDLIRFCWLYRTFTQWFAALSTEQSMKTNIQKTTSEWSVQCWHCLRIRQAWFFLHITVKYPYCCWLLSAHRNLGTPATTKTLEIARRCPLPLPPTPRPRIQGSGIDQRRPDGRRPASWGDFLLMGLQHLGSESGKLPWVSNMI